MKPSWTLNIVLLIVVLIGGFYAWNSSRQDPVDDSRIEISSLKLSDFSEINIEFPSRQPTQFKLTEQGWRMMKPYQARADELYVYRVLGILATTSLIKLPADDLEKYGLEKEQLYKIIDGESSFNLTAQNASGATGLFQFIPSTAEGLGVTTDQILNMSAYEQLEVYDRYLDQTNYRGGDLGIIQAAPAYYGKPDDFEVYGRNTKAWEQNPPWRGPDGRITVGSINAYYNNR